MVATVLRGVGRWAGRLLLAGFAVAFLGTAPHDTAEGLLGLVDWILGVTFAAGLVATFRPVTKVGTVVVWVGLWALFTWYGVVAFVRPSEVVSDSQLSQRGPDVDTPLGAYVLGTFSAGLANLPVAVALWTLRPRRTPTTESVVAPPRVEDEVLERRQRSKRRRKRRLRRR